MKKEVFLSAALALMLGVSYNAFGQDLEYRDMSSHDYGNWTGKLKTSEGVEPLVLGLYKDQDGVDKCYLLKPKQNMDTIPAVLEFLSKDSVAVSSPAIGFKFRGINFLNWLDGDMILNGDTSYMSFDYVDGKRFFLEGRRRPQTPQPPFSYKTEEVVFSNADASLSGTLSLPANISGKVPVVIMSSGIVFRDRNNEMFEHKPFAVIADYLAKNGIASLRYDNRGVEKSTGDREKATVFDFANDTEAGIALLRKDPRFSKVGILGHGEGGSIAFIIGAKGSADFLVTLAAPAIKGDELEVSSSNKISDIIDSQLRIRKLDKLDKKANRHYEKYQKKGGNTDSLSGFEVLSVKKNEPMTVAKYREENYGKGYTLTDSFLDYDPTQDIQNIKCPVFALNGIKDCRVLPELNLDKLKKLVKSPKSKFKKYPDLNYYFQHCTSGLMSDAMDIEETISEEVLKDIAEWVKGL